MVDLPPVTPPEPRNLSVDTTLIMTLITKVDDLVDKVEDIFDKCNDIFEHLTEG